MKKYVIITLTLAIVGLIAGFTYSAGFDSDEYTSDSKLVVQLPKSANQAKDFASIATSSSVISYAKEKAGMSEDENVVASYVTATSPSGTNIIDISVTTGNPESAKKLNQAVTEGTEQQVALLYNENDSLVQIDAPSNARITHNAQPIKTAIVGAIGGIAGGLLIVFVIYPTKPAESDEFQPQPVTQTPIDATPAPAKTTPAAAKPVRSTTKPVGSPVAPKKPTAAKPVRSTTRPVGSPVAPKKPIGHDRELDDILRELDKMARK